MAKAQIVIVKNQTSFSLVVFTKKNQHNVNGEIVKQGNLRVMPEGCSSQRLEMSLPYFYGTFQTLKDAQTVFDNHI